MRSGRVPVLHILVPLASVSAAVALRWALNPWLDGHPRLLFHFLAIVVSGWYGGLVPALIAMALSVLAGVVLFPYPFAPSHLRGLSGWIWLGVFLLAGTCVAAMTEAMHRARRRAEARTGELSQSRRMLQSVLDTIPVRVFWKDRESRILGCNRLFAKDAGLDSPQQLIGRTDFEMTWKAQAELYVADDRRVMESGDPKLNYEEPQTTPTGQRLWLSTSKVPLRDAEGNVIGVLCTYEDITPRKLAEEAIAASQRAAEDASHAKDRFLAVLSHELRTPLTPVLAVSAMLENDARLPRDVADELAMIRRNVELEARLIDDLLDLTRISRGKLEIRPQLVDACTVIGHALEVCSPDMDAKGLHVTFNSDQGPHWVLADPPRLQQVFWNLIKNAVKFTPASGCVGVRCANEGGATVAVEVTDSGVGIDPELLPRIFDAFEQGGQTVTREFGGLGLGLAISKALVDMQGGVITAQSEGRDKGATFRVSFPAAAPPPQPPAPRKAPEPAAARQAGERCRHRILLVEDHIDTARIISQLLRASDYDVRTAGTVADALRLSAQEEFDLVVSDLGLPDGSGLDLIRSMHERHPDLKGIALSGFGMDEDIARSRQAGFIEHITKPVNFNYLQDVIAHALE